MTACVNVPLEDVCPVASHPENIKVQVQLKFRQDSPAGPGGPLGSEVADLAVTVDTKALCERAAGGLYLHLFLWPLPVLLPVLSIVAGGDLRVRVRLGCKLEEVGSWPWLYSSPARVPQCTQRAGVIPGSREAAVGLASLVKPDSCGNPETSIQGPKHPGQGPNNSLSSSCAQHLPSGNHSHL